jgi:glutathionylspermidine synthase
VNVLQSSLELSPELEKSGYVVKPIRGSGGNNVKIVDADGKVIQQKSGKWGNDQMAYQELYMLPKIGDKYVQVSAWIVEGHYAGTILRASETPIVDSQSSLCCLRVIPDN